jgi:hypothetical protein
VHKRRRTEDYDFIALRREVRVVTRHITLSVHPLCALIALAAQYLRIDEAESRRGKIKKKKENSEGTDAHLAEKKLIRAALLFNR